MKKEIIRKRISFKSTVAAGSVLEKFVKALGAKQVLNDPGLSIHQLEDGTLLEIYGTGSTHPERIFEKGNMVMSFKVDDLEKSVGQLVADGATVIGEIIRPCATYGYCHLLLNDKIVVGVYQES